MLATNGKLYVYTVDYGRFSFQDTPKVDASWDAAILRRNLS